jgi:hypothetical protein
MRKFGFKFHVATGLGDQLLQTMWKATGWVLEDDDVPNSGDEEGEDLLLTPFLPLGWGG